MGRLGFFCISLISFFSLSAIAFAQNTTHKQFYAYMALEQKVSSPIGFKQFCSDYPQECSLEHASYRDKKSYVILTQHKWHFVNQLNKRINHSIYPVTDYEQFGKAEHWSYPHNNAGDCEDYVLLKRKKLLEQGWPASALLITVVFDEVNEGHAVLTLVTDRGDFILDNKTDEIRRWDTTPYTYIMRQSSKNTLQWVSINDKRAPHLHVLNEIAHK